MKIDRSGTLTYYPFTRAATNKYVEIECDFCGLETFGDKFYILLREGDLEFKAMFPIENSVIHFD